MGQLTDDLSDRMARAALGAVNREYPYKSGFVLRSDEDAVPPRTISPLFYGCFDWHSAVHSHWTLARLLRLAPRRPWRDEAEKRFSDYFSDQAVSRETSLVEENPGFETPYGLVWVLTLCDELRHDFHSEPMSRRLKPLESAAVTSLERWMRSLSHPVRSGVHGQSAFAMTLLLRWAHTHHSELAKLVRHRALGFHADDRDAPLGYEPSAYDFLSPSLGVAELMGEVLPPHDFSRWLDDYAPTLHEPSVLRPVETVDRSDGRLAHFDGLNLSRAWMLRSISESLPDDDGRQSALMAMAQEHGSAGLEGLDSDEYAVTHWLPTFATRWLTGIG